MARQPKTVRPLFDVHHEFTASLERFIHEAGMLADALGSALSLEAVDPKLVAILQGRMEAFRKAQSGDAAP